ncbi:MAG: phosphoribosylglycinamide formyltransferase [Pseudomonadota bacterium]
MTARKKVAVLISGRGSNMEALLDATIQPDYPAEICGVLSNRETAKGLEIAAMSGVPTAHVDHRAFASRAAFDEAVESRVLEWDADLIACAGFLRIFSEEFVERWSGRMINIHPSLLPLFKGLNTHEQALAAGVRVHGCSTHFVTSGVDEGPLILQAAVPVLHDDTPDSLAARVLSAEHRLYPQTLRLVASGRAQLSNGQTLIAEPVYDPSARLSPRIRP